MHLIIPVICHYTLINLQLPAKPAIKRLYLPRSSFVTYFRYIMGHGSFNKHLNKLKLSETPYCSCDGLSVDDLNPRVFSCSINRNAINFLGLELAKNNLLPHNFTSLMSPYTDKILLSIRCLCIL